MADDGPPPAAGPGPSSTAAAAAAAAAAEPDAPLPAVLFKRPAARARGNLRRNRARGGGGGEDGSDDGHEGGGTTGLTKRPRPSAAAAPLVASTRATAAGPSSDLLPARYGGDRTRQSGRDDLATAQVETETEFDRDNR